MTEGQMCDVNPAFEFDAPRYHNFESLEPESPSQTDAWFDTDGPKGMATPHSEDFCQPMETMEEELRPGQGEAVAMELEEDGCAAGPEAPPAASAATAVPGTQKWRGVGPSSLRVPSNLVTSWAGEAASRVLTCLTNQDPDAKATAGEGSKKAGQSGGGLQKRTGFITPRRPRPQMPSRTAGATPRMMQIKDEKANPRQKADSKEQSSWGGRKMSAPVVAGSAKPAKRQKTQEQSKPEAVFTEGKNKAGCDGGRTKRSKEGAPQLSTSSRARPPRFKTREEMEEEEMAAMPRFKARPYSGQKGERLSLASQSARQASPGAAASEQQPFKARPVDPRILQGPTFVAKHSALEPTIPQAPSFVTDTRQRIHKASQGASPAYIFKAADSSTRKAGRQSTGVTEPQPFNLATDLRGQATQAALEEARRRAEEGERKAREFHAHPMPATTQPPTPLEHSSPVFTMPEPFHLEGEKRHAEVLALQELLNQQEEERKRQLSQFKARPMPKGEAFQPHKSDRLLTIPDDVHLAGDARSRQRAEFDAAVLEKELHQQAERERQAAEARRVEEQEIREIRKNQEFKARPMPEYKSGLPSLRLPPPQWTEPVGPHLATEERAAARAKQTFND